VRRASRDEILITHYKLFTSHKNTLKAGLQDNRALRWSLFMQSQENSKGAESISEDTRDWLSGGNDCERTVGVQ